MISRRSSVAHRLPRFPWDSLSAARSQAAAHPGGLVDLSVGTPIDPVSDVIREALAADANKPGYPTVQGSLGLRAAVVDALKRRYEVSGLTEADVLPVIGSKEFIAWLPTQVGFRTTAVAIPELAYPTYEIGSLIAGIPIIRTDDFSGAGPTGAALVYVNSPSNPTGEVLDVGRLRGVVDWARSHNAIVVSDECYLGLAWEKRTVSILHPDVCDGDHTNLLAVHSLSKSSNLASYRAGFVAGDTSLVAELLEVRKHSGMMVPQPVQSAMLAALQSDKHENQQRERYRARREVLRAAVLDAGFSIDHSEAGLYLWVTNGVDCRATAEWFAARGILVAPGDLYGPSGASHVRLSLTASDERIESAAERIRR